MHSHRILRLLKDDNHIMMNPRQDDSSVPRYRADADQTAVSEVLGGDWAGVEPDKVLATQTFFVDVMRNAPALELTVRSWP